MITTSVLLIALCTTALATGFAHYTRQYHRFKNQATINNQKYPLHLQ